MAGSHESNPNTQIVTSSKKSKTGKSGHHKSGKSGQQHEQSGNSGKKHKKSVRFSEEPSSKRQRIEDDPSVYKDGPLEAVSGKFENAKPYFSYGMFVDLDKIEELGFGHLRVYLYKYM